MFAYLSTPKLCLNSKVIDFPINEREWKPLTRSLMRDSKRDFRKGEAVKSSLKCDEYRWIRQKEEESINEIENFVWDFLHPFLRRWFWGKSEFWDENHFQSSMFCEFTLLGLMTTFMLSVLYEENWFFKSGSLRKKNSYVLLFKGCNSKKGDE